MPSREIGDARLLFTTNGVIHKECAYTVLGLSMECYCNVSLDTYNELSPSLGYPFVIHTNLDYKASLELKSDVLFTNGVYRLALTNTTGRIQVWADAWVETEPNYWHTIYHPPILLLDTSERTERYFTALQWQALVLRRGSGRSLPVYLTSDSAGHCDLDFSYVRELSTGSLHAHTRQRVTSVNPPLLPDYNRDGSVDGADLWCFMDGRTCYFWANDDTWTGDDAFAPYDVGVHLWPMTLPSNGRDMVVNGRNDLVNLCPFAVDLSAFVDTWGTNAVTYSFFTEAPGDVRFVPIKTEWDSFGSIVKTDQKTVANTNLHESALDVTGRNASGDEIGYAIPPGMLPLAAARSGALAVEFATPAFRNLRIVVKDVTSGETLFEAGIGVRVLNVHDMYRWMNLEAACGEDAGDKYNERTDVLWPDSEHADANVVFVHGYNVHPSEAWDWSQQVFKRLWWSGMDAGFTAVLWRGNQSQVWKPKLKPGDGNCYVTKNYHQNVLNAFRSAAMLKDKSDELPGARKYFMAHSLGNMLVSAARQDHGLQYERYMMLNAAVAIAAYDPSTNAITEKSKFDMTPPEWRDYTNTVRSTHWYELFPANDARRALTWNGRFKDVDKTVNFYSSEDEVVANGDDSVDELLSRKFAWYNQEMQKGGYLVDLVPEAGWAFGANYMVEESTGWWPDGQMHSYTRHYNAVEAAGIDPEDLKTRPLFSDFLRRQVYGAGGHDFLSSTNEVSRMKPSPEGPKPTPGVQTTWAP